MFTIYMCISTFSLEDILFDGAGIRAGGAFITGGSVRARLGTLTLAANTLTSASTQKPYVAHAGVGSYGTVTVLT